MNLGEIARKRAQAVTLLTAALTLLVSPQIAFSQPASEFDAVAPNVASEAEPLPGTAEATADNAVAETAPFDHYGPEMIKGQPVDGGLSFQPQYTEDGHYALWFHDAILMPAITIVTLLVLALLMWVIVRYNRRRNTVPSKTSHNTTIEVIWTVVPVLILVVIAVPSITLLARQYESPPEDALTVKVTGYQWYWGYAFPDNGGFEVISNMMDEADAVAAGVPPQLEVDNRLVLPVGEPIRLQITGADVIHSFGVPSLWFKLDAVPGRINERMLTIEEPGIYYGQCMELCGARHAYMPIAIEARPRTEFEAWVLAQGGTLGDEAEVIDTGLELESEGSVEGPLQGGEAPLEDTAAEI